jgi:hypothetical protein
MKQCALSQLQRIYELCEGRITWHHPWIYAGRQIGETWAIVPACEHHHRMVESEPAVKAAFEAASLLLATEEDLACYPRKPWGRIKKALGLQADTKTKSV